MMPLQNCLSYFRREKSQREKARNITPIKSLRAGNAAASACLTTENLLEPATEKCLRALAGARTSERSASKAAKPVEEAAPATKRLEDAIPKTEGVIGDDSAKAGARGEGAESVAENPAGKESGAGELLDHMGHGAHVGHAAEKSLEEKRDNDTGPQAP